MKAKRFLILLAAISLSLLASGCQLIEGLRQTSPFHH